MPSPSVAIQFDGHSFSSYQVQLACALNHCPEITEDTKSSILGSLQGGPGAPSLSCRELVREIERSFPDIYAAVASNGSYWKRKAREEHRSWWDTMSQIVQRYVREPSIQIIC